MSIDLFKEILPALTHTKENLLNVENEKEYNPFTTNRALSHYMDCILHVNEMNINHHLDKKMQYDFYLYSIRKGKRFSKWIKKKESETIDALKAYFHITESKAKELINILSTEQKDNIIKTMDKGGTK